MANVTRHRASVSFVVVLLFVWAAYPAQAGDQDLFQFIDRGLQLLDRIQDRGSSATSPPSNQTQYRPNPLSKGAAASRYHWCAPLNHAALSAALAAAPLGESARSLVFGSSDVGDAITECASQLHHHLCTTKIINLTGSFLTGGPGANAFVDALPEVTDAVATRRVNPYGLAGAAAVGSFSKWATGSNTLGAVGGVVGYGAGNTVGKAVSALSCEQRRTMVVAMSNRFRQPAPGDQARAVDRLFTKNRHYVPDNELSVYEFALALSREMRRKARNLERTLN